MVILDTNIIIDHLRRDPTDKSHFVKVTEKVSRDELAISLITIQELYRGSSTRSSHEKEKLLTVLSSLKIFSYDFEIAQLAGELSRDSAIFIEFPDAAIAATAIIHDAKLFTLNKKDFARIKNLELYS